MTRVLVVEDDIDLCETLALLMENLGAEKCLKATSFEEVKKLDLRGVDLAVLDVNLGAELPSGLDVHQYLREKYHLGRVLFLTGHAASHPLVKEAEKIPGVNVMVKPVDIEEFSRVITELK